jgi:hypothetical protein
MSILNIEKKIWENFSNLIKIRNFQTRSTLKAGLVSNISYQIADGAVLGWHRGADHQNFGRRPRIDFSKNNIKSET